MEGCLVLFLYGPDYLPEFRIEELSLVPSPVDEDVYPRILGDLPDAVCVLAVDDPQYVIEEPDVPLYHLDPSEDAIGYALPLQPGDERIQVTQVVCEYGTRGDIPGVHHSLADHVSLLLLG